MTGLAALHARVVLELAWWVPLFEASCLLVADVITLSALDYVFLVALSCLMTDFVAFKAHLLGAFERVMALFAAEDAGLPLGLVGALLGHVSELAAVVALDGWVFIGPVPHPLVLLQGVKVCNIAVFIQTLLSLLLG